MKMNKIFSFLLAGAFLGQTVPAKSITFDPTILPMAAMAITAAQYALRKLCPEICLRPYDVKKNDNSGKLHDVELASDVKDYEPALQSHLKDLADKHHGLKNITILPSEKMDVMGTFTDLNLVLIKKKYYETLLDSMNPDNTVDKDRINWLKATFHHELGHMKNNSSSNKPNAILASSLITNAAAIKIMLSMPKNNFLQCCAATLVGAGMYLAHTMATTLYSKYDEMRADDAIPNDAELLEASEKTHRELHDTTMVMLKHYPSAFPWYQRPFTSLIPYTFWEKYPQLTELLYLHDEHPSPYFRAERLKARRLALENKNEQNDEVSKTESDEKT